MLNRILIVDDNKDLACAMSKMLTICGFQTATAFNGQTALRTARSFQPQIALLDIGLPDINGSDVAKMLREDLVTSHIMLIATSAMEPLVGNSARSQTNFDLYFVKPVDIELLLVALNAAKGE